jgi:transcription elongation factor Elf1
MTERSDLEFKPIEKEAKYKDRIYFCVGCGSVATQTAFLKTDGGKIGVMYCGAWASIFYE